MQAMDANLNRDQESDAVDVCRVFHGALPETPTPLQRTMISATMNLSRGATRMKKIQIDQIAMNFELMAFAINWYGFVSYTQ
jgi:hypothetical protein